MDNNSVTRGYKFKLKKPITKNKTRKCFFVSIRVINDWNSFPTVVVNAVSLNSFKTKLDNIWSDKEYKI